MQQEDPVQQWPVEPLPVGRHVFVEDVEDAVVEFGDLFRRFAAERIELALGRSRTLILSLLTGAAFAGIPAVTANPYAIGAVFLLGGAGVTVWNVVVVSLRQRIIPDHLLGRATSGHRLVAWGTKPLGAAASGLLAEVFGLRPVFAGAAAVILLLVLLTPREW
ncbi:hypothetical protein [Amycolatopsis sp. cmx-4-54]|uniref:hypothetical protein n=1 Tax=Amycolatopsis sp. cmx-4-54 TaxID=2790936 RepID=UPI00397BB350